MDTCVRALSLRDALLSYAGDVAQGLKQPPCGRGEHQRRWHRSACDQRRRLQAEQRLHADMSGRAAFRRIIDLVARSGRRREPGRGHALQRAAALPAKRSEEHTSELQSLMRISYAVFCLKKKKQNKDTHNYI